jgi:hypothetical protein
LLKLDGGVGYRVYKFKEGGGGWCREEVGEVGRVMGKWLKEREGRRGGREGEE